MSSKHRPTLKHVPKPFKSSHRTKSQLKREKSKRKPGSGPRTSIRSTLPSIADHKANRKNAAKNTRTRKRAAAAHAKRAGTSGGPPKVVVLLPLSPEPGVGTEGILRALLGRSEQGEGALEDALPVLGGPVTVTYPSLKARLTYVVAPVGGDVLEVLAALQVADVVVPVVDATYGVDEENQVLMSMMLAQGMPASIALLRNLDQVGGANKNKAKTRKAFSRFLNNKLGGETPLHTLDSETDVGRVLQLLAKCKTRRIVWRDSRPFLMTESVEYDPDTCALRVGGYLRGSGLSANQLMSFPGKGTYAISALYEAPDPIPLTRGQAKMEAEPTEGHPNGWALLGTRSPIHGHSLEQLLPPEEGEDDEDYAARMADFDDDSDDDGNNNPYGLSDDDDDFGPAPKPRSAAAGAKTLGDVNHHDVVKSEIDHAWADYLGLSDDDEEMGVGKEEDDDVEDDGEGELNNVPDEDDEDEDGDMLVQTLADKAAEDFEWPDEMFAPRAPMCKDLFRGWRGLKSFMHSPWDPYEDLPSEYSQIYEFESLNRTENEVVEEIESAGKGLDRYVVVELMDVPGSFMESLSATGVVTGFGLFRYERQWSVVHMPVTRHASFDEALASGARVLILQGFRLLESTPMFSSENPRCAKNKFERFFHAGSSVTASVYGPITFGNAPVLMFRLPEEGAGLQLIATGSVSGPAPEKLIIKRTILTGEPFHIHKSKATIRRMFHYPEDIRWFRRIEVYTKYGRTGHIIEPLGTHGYMKVQFDGILDARDTVCLPLYTRIYPQIDTRVVDVETVIEPHTLGEVGGGLSL